MRILAIYKHYWPDTTPYARLLRTLLENAVQEGHTAEVCSAQPSYRNTEHERQPRREILGGVAVRRIFLPGRSIKSGPLAHVVSVLFLIGSILFAVRHRKRFDVVIANSHPPLLMGWTLRFLRRWAGLPYVLHAQDIHPEGGLLAGELQDGWLTRRLMAGDRAACENAVRIVTLSEDMKQTLLSRPGRPLDASRLRVINNCPLERYATSDEISPFFQNTGRDHTENSPPFRVLFAGNMGVFQNLDRVIDAALEVAHHSQPIEFHFMGGGRVTEQLKSRAGTELGRTVHFHPFQPVEVAFAAMSECDLGIVSLVPGLYRVAYPSKTMMYLAAGLPVLGLIEAESELASELADYDFGYVPQSDTPKAIAATILRAFADRKRWTDSTRVELTDRAERLFGGERALRQWSRFWSELETELTGNTSTQPPCRAAA